MHDFMKRSHTGAKPVGLLFGVRAMGADGDGVYRALQGAAVPVWPV